MVRLQKSQALGRIIRQDAASELVASTWTLVREAVRAGKIRTDAVVLLGSSGRGLTWATGLMRW